MTPAARLLHAELRFPELGRLLKDSQLVAKHAGLLLDRCLCLADIPVT